jgi:predicted lipoprotein
MLQNLSVTRIMVLEKLLYQEVGLHESTKSLLMRSQSYCEAWQQAHAAVRAELHHVQVQLSSVEKAARDVLNENYRLKDIINQIVNAPFVSKSVR